MLVAIASGKGGTGKTTVAANLARVLNAPVSLLDCDVEEPNAHLFVLGVCVQQETVTLPVPEVDPTQCNACGECGRFCAYNAIAAIGNPPLIFAEMCHGCGGCMKVCPTGAIHEIQKRVGVVEILEARGITLIQGRLDVGVAMAPPLIRAVKERLISGGIAILDAPPGTSCPVVATLRGVDYIVLVTEPTPFGMHDLSLAVDMTRELNIPFGVVVNRMGSGDNRVHAYCRAEKIPVLLEIADDRCIAEAYSRGLLMVDVFPEHARQFRELARKLGLLQ